MHRMHVERNLLPTTSRYPSLSISSWWMRLMLLLLIDRSLVVRHNPNILLIDLIMVANVDQNNLLVGDDHF